jgi:hypothetical protein
MLKQQSTLTGLSAVLFGAGVVLLFLALFHDADRNGPLLWSALLLLIATVVSWLIAASAGEREG